MCFACPRPDSHNARPKSEKKGKDEEEFCPPPPPPAPSHDSAPTFAACRVAETTPDSEAELRPQRPPFGIVVYDTTHTARPSRSTRLARALFDRTYWVRSVPRHEDDQIEVVTLPLPEPFLDAQRVDACIRHHGQEIQSRLLIPDKAEAASWFLPERIMDWRYTRRTVATNLFDDDGDDDVEVASWEESLGEEIGISYRDLKR
ncbi:ArcA-like protein [Colletotrichum truncatum]|uniref:ArcA-like protein n=1 Tax=Colletotrichum truncatum TaxID=5467 RepID=A0ACC3YH10_COLTU|nr:ArcA-like protein [Colletotrichum truncatum]KAF6784112.1 ArcA-like protein [Colletotrichum truncatum]